jgi:hypothetical protein
MENACKDKTEVFNEADLKRNSFFSTSSKYKNGDIKFRKRRLLIARFEREFGKETSEKNNGKKKFSVNSEYLISDLKLSSLGLSSKFGILIS